VNTDRTIDPRRENPQGQKLRFFFHPWLENNPKLLITEAFITTV